MLRDRVKENFVILVKYIDHQEQVIVRTVKIVFKYLTIIVHLLITVLENVIINFSLDLLEGWL